MKKQIMTLIIISIMISAASLSAGDWPAFRGNLQRTGFSQEETGYPQERPLWTADLHCAFVSSPSVANGILYIGGRDSTLYAIDANTGRILWRVRTNGWVDSSPLIWEGTVIVGSRDGWIYILDAQTGMLVSRRKAGLQLSSPGLSVDNMLITGLGPPLNGIGLYDLSGTDTAARWQAAFPQMSYSSPAISGDLAVIGANNGVLYGINSVSRDTSWTLRTGGGVYLSTPAIENTTVYFAPGDYDPNVYAVNLGNGRSLWKALGKPSAGPLPAKKNTAAVIPPALFVQLLKLSPTHRRDAIEQLRRQGYGVPAVLEKEYEIPGKAAMTAGDAFYAYGGMKTSSVAVGPRNVFVIRKELGYPKPRFTLLALDKSTGREQWRFSELRDAPQLGYCASPVLTREFVAFGWGEGKAYILAGETGETLWEGGLPGPVISSPAIADGKIYFATYNGYLCAYELNGTPLPLNFRDGTYSYPNPARKTARIQYFPEKTGNVDVRIFDSAERMVKHFSKNGASARVKGKFDWDVSNAANGVYFAIVKITYKDGKTDVKNLKIAVIKGAK